MNFANLTVFYRIGLRYGFFAQSSRKRRSEMRGFNVVVALVVVFVLFASANLAQAGLSDSWDLGDVRGGYSTEAYNSEGGQQYVNLYAYFGGQHKIESSSASFFPDYWYEWDEENQVMTRTQHGYRVDVNFSGRIGNPLTLADVGYSGQSNSFDARGINIEESTWLDNRKLYYRYDETGNGIGDYYLVADSVSNIHIGNFAVTRANGRYSEYTWNHKGGFGGEGEDSVTSFNYNVSWHGDFLPDTVSPGFVAPAVTTSASAVPEPASLLSLAAGALGIFGFLSIRRWR